MNNFEKTIQNYLEELASSDNVFAAKFENPNKSIKDCCKYICKEVSKQRSKESCVICTDQEVFGMAVHYYDEEFLPIEASVKTEPVVKVATSAPVKAPKPRKQRAKKVEAVAVENELPDELIIPLF